PRAPDGWGGRRGVRQMEAGEDQFGAADIYDPIGNTLYIVMVGGESRTVLSATPLVDEHGERTGFRAFTFGIGDGSVRRAVALPFGQFGGPLENLIEGADSIEH